MTELFLRGSSTPRLNSRMAVSVGMRRVHDGGRAVLAADDLGASALEDALQQQLHEHLP
jgi:hypothetical protein